MSAARIIGARVDATTYDEAVATIGAAAATAQPAWVCCANVHMVVTARDLPALRATMDGALLVTPDGMPLRWALRCLGHRLPDRVYGPELAWRLLAAAERSGLPVALYGGRPESAAGLDAELRRRLPRLRVVCSIVPPFRALTPDEDAADIAALTASGARLILVGLGCPKQELWMQGHSAALPAVLIGVGAFFDFAAGRVAQAPRWMQRCGLEWLFRLGAEPGRLGPRYLRTNPRFVVLFAWQLMRRLFSARPADPTARR